MSSTRFTKHVIAAVFALALHARAQVVTAAVAGQAATSNVGVPSNAQTLRQAAALRGIPFGSAVDASEFLPGVPDPLVSDATYTALLGSQFSMVQPENNMKDFVISTGNGTYNFAPADEVVAFAQANNQLVRGHVLLYPQAVSNAAWLCVTTGGTAPNVCSSGYAATATTAQMYTQLQNYVTTVATHFAGKIWAWDAANEVLCDGAGSGEACDSTNTYKSSPWFDSPGIGLSQIATIEKVFTWAHAADPNARLCLTDYNLEQVGTKFNNMVALLTQMIADGTPITCVGMQMHTDISGTASQYAASAIQTNVAAIAALGLKVHFSEIDVKIPMNLTTQVSTSANLAAQAAEYAVIANAAMQNPAVEAMQVWGVDDKYSYHQTDGTGLANALPFDINGVPTVSFTALMGALLNRQAPASNAVAAITGGTVFLNSCNTTGYVLAVGCLPDGSAPAFHLDSTGNGGTPFTVNSFHSLWYVNGSALAAGASETSTQYFTAINGVSFPAGGIVLMSTYGGGDITLGGTVQVTAFCPTAGTCTVTRKNISTGTVTTPTGFLTVIGLF